MRRPETRLWVASDPEIVDPELNQTHEIIQVIYVILRRHYPYLALLRRSHHHPEGELHVMLVHTHTIIARLGPGVQ